MKRHLYFFVSIFGIAISVFLISSLYHRVVVLAGDGTSGDPYTVCASGCDFTTISGAVNAASDGEYVSILETYSRNTEVWPISFGDTGITVSCESGDVVVGPTTTVADASIDVSADSVLSNCQLTGTDSWETAELNLSAGSVVEGMSITDVPFASIGSTTTINNNTISFTYAGGQMFLFSNSSAGTVISENSISYTSEEPSVGDNNIIFSDNLLIGTTNISNVSITDNTIYMGSGVDNGRIMGIYEGGSNIEFARNIVEYEGNNVGVPGLFFLYFRGSTSASFDFSHNSFLVSSLPDGTGLPAVVIIENITGHGNDVIVGTIEYNAFYFDGSGTDVEYAAITINVDTDDPDISEDYNGFAGQFIDGGFSQGENSVLVLGGHSQSIDTSPFRTGDANPANDFALTPYSSFIDVNGTLDIGAMPATRESSFDIGNCVVDYTSCDATSTAVLSDHVRTGDTWTIGSGTFESFSIVSSSLVTSSVSISGAEDGTTIIAGSSSTYYGVQLSGLASSSIEYLHIESVTSTQISYMLSLSLFEHGSDEYTGEELFGAPSLIFLPTESCDDITSFASTQYDATSLVGDATGSFHLALVDAGGAKGTILVNNSIASSAGEIDTMCSGVGLTTDVFVSNIFTVSGGVYTYNSAAASAASVSVISGYTNPPTLTRVENVATGISLVDVSDISISSVTSTDNLVGISILSDEGDVSLDESVISSSLSYDVVVSSAVDHYFRNVAFTAASSTITGSGSVIAQYRVRASVSDPSLDPVVGAQVSFVDALGAVSSTQVTNGSGVTPYTPYMTAFVLTDGDVGTEAGGYNPWDVTVSATSTLAASSTEVVVFEPNQEVSFVLAEAAGAPDAPSGVSISTSTISTTALTVTWVDESSDEDEFVVEYVASSSTDDFPGVTSTVASNATSTTLTGLSPNTPYIVRILARNGVGDSAYVTSTAVYTTAVAPTVAISSKTTSTVTVTLTQSAGTAAYVELNNTTLAQIVTSTSGVFSLTGLSPNTSYSLVARAYNENEVASASSTTSTVTVATAPTSLVATVLSATQVGLDWDDVGATQYKVYQDGSLSLSTALDQATMSSLTCATEYVFGVVSVNSANEINTNTTTVSATTSACPTNSGSSGGAYFIPKKPTIPIGRSAMDGAVEINENAVQTQRRAVTLSFFVDGAAEYAVSEQSDFADASFVRLTSMRVPYTLSVGDGEKRVYVKFRTTQGGTLTVTDTIDLRESVSVEPEEIVPTAPVSPIKRPSVSSENEAELSCAESIGTDATYAVRFGVVNTPAHVRTIEKFLNRYEAAGLVVDGVYSVADRDAVIKWQEKYATSVLAPWGLRRGTGFVYTSSLRQMSEIHRDACQQANVREPSVVALSVCLDTDQTLVFGQISQSVRQAQTQLRALGYLDHVPTGYYGLLTQAAVRSFQQAQDITPLGIIGPATRARLNALSGCQ